MVAEMDKLKTMVRKTEDRQQLGELMAQVAEKTTVALAVKPDRAESKVRHFSCSPANCTPDEGIFRRACLMCSACSRHLTCLRTWISR